MGRGAILHQIVDPLIKANAAPDGSVLTCHATSPSTARHINVPHINIRFLGCRMVSAPRQLERGAAEHRSTPSRNASIFLPPTTLTAHLGSNILIDGQTNAGWLIEQVQESAG
jgi:hypothetical protein